MATLDASTLIPLAQIPATLTGKDADTLDTYHASAFSLVGHNHDAAYAPLSHVSVADAHLPSQTGNNGKFLQTNGTATSWQTVSGGTSDHSLLSNLAYAVAGHTGFEPTVAKGNLTAGSNKITIGGVGTGALIGAGASVDVTEGNLTHNNIGGLTLGDPHTQYTLLLGRSGGQTLIGGTASGDNLTLQSTSNATKGKILFGASAYDEVNNRLGIGTASPGATLDVRGSAVFNENGGGYDFRIEGDTVSDLFFVDASQDRIKMGKAGQLLNNVQIEGGLTFGDFGTSDSFAIFGGNVAGDTTNQTGLQFTSRRLNNVPISYTTAGAKATGSVYGSADITGFVAGGDFYGDVDTNTLWYTDIAISELIGIRGSTTSGYVEGNQTTVAKSISVKAEGTIGDSSVNKTNAYNFYSTAHQEGDNRYSMWLEKQSGGTINSGIVLDGDGTGADIVLGDGQDVTFNYNGANTILANLVGTGQFDVQMDLSLTAQNIVTDTTTGTKIGTATTQKLAFYNSTPIVQPTNTTDLRTALINLGLLASGGVTPLNLNGGALTAGSLALTTDLPITEGGTGQSTAQAAINALTNVAAATNEYVLTKDTATGNAIFKVSAGGGSNHNLLSATHPDTVAASAVLGDTLYGNATPAWTKLAGNTTTTKKFLIQTGTGAISAIPAWDVVTAGDLPTGIDAVKIGAGAVDNTEFGYLNGVTSAIQTQLDTKQAGEGHISMFPFNYATIVQGSWAFSSISGSWGAHIFDNNSTPAINDALDFQVYLAAGTYSLSVLYRKTSAAGIIEFYSTTDSNSIGTIDAYAATATNNNLSTLTSYTVSTSGLKTIRMRSTTKNASSTNYVMVVNCFTFFKTA